MADNFCRLFVALLAVWLLALTPLLLLQPHDAHPVGAVLAAYDAG